ncbi:hypothetical protein Cgig2_010056 [Carnegiea gigantea]|uniref:DNA-directed RNA polymerase n=1 Tax=Carnegiea gigantea TaxID=171969 RepID=A0A9Q1QBF0_9CARY|nr:hypothetical protein Cgig2_010056 [Carnegiea gigantea]
MKELTIIIRSIQKNPFFVIPMMDAIGAYRQKRINLDSPLWLRWRLDQRVIASSEAPIEVHYESLGTYHEIYGHYLIVRSVKKEILFIYKRTTVGHIYLYREISEAIQGFCRACSYERANFVFHNKAIDGTAMKRLISRLIDHFGMAYTSHILDQQSLILEKHHHYGNVHAVEKLRQSIEIWYSTSEYLRQEMNQHLLMTDPYNPVHIMSFSGAIGNMYQVHQLVGMRGLISDTQGQMIDLPMKSNLREGLSLTEYLISCYGARFGVVDTAVRTSDAGYLTRRLVEVVQHKKVRRTDCGTLRGLSVSPRNGMMRERILIQLVTIYIWVHGAWPPEIFISGLDLSASWICRLCYGRSPTHGDLVELGEAVGGTAEHVRAPSNGKRKFNEDLVHPTRTRHGHPALLCYIDLYVTIEIQNNQYVESEQVIAEIRAGTSTKNLKERVRKHIDSDSEGEMHWSTDVYHAPEFTYIQKAVQIQCSHLFAPQGSRSNERSFSFFRTKIDL